MKARVKKAAGVSIGRMRFDGVRMQDIGKGRPQAEKHRERMAERGSLTDEVVRDIMGGSQAAEKQARAYSEIIDSIKGGRGTRGAAGSLAEAARNRMIERDEHPDKGHDKANRRAYPPETGRA